MSLRLGFYFHIPAIEKEGQIWLPGFLGRFIDSLAVFCESVVYFAHTPRTDEYDILDYEIRSANVTLVNIGPHDSVIKRTFFPGRYTLPFRDWHTRLDVLLIRGPSPLLPAIAKAVRHLPVTLLLVGDYLTGINDLQQPWWRRQLIRMWAYWYSWMQGRVISKSLTFVNSHKLYTQLHSKVPNLVETRTTTLEQGDFFEREDTCQFRPIHLLFTGRLSAAKGLFDIVCAMTTLVSQDLDLVLDLVGWPAKGEEDILERLNTFAQKKGLDGRIIYHGYKAVGPELFAYYRQADIFVLASSTSEGFPRTIWEAMAHSLPVIATRVGSIPAFIEDAAELVAPNDPDGLANAIQRLSQSSEVRKTYIRQGIELAKKNTLEIQTKRLVNFIQIDLSRKII